MVSSTSGRWHRKLNHLTQLRRPVQLRGKKLGFMMKDSLSGVDMLPDPLDLSMRGGAGIKTYGLWMVSVLKEPGAQPCWLVSAGTKRHARRQSYG